MYGIANSGKLFSDELTEWFLESGFIQYQCQMSIYYNYATDGKKVVVLSYSDDCVYWYTSEAIGEWFVDTLRNRISISQMRDHSISVYQARYDTSIVNKYLDTSTVNTG